MTGHAERLIAERRVRGKSQRDTVRDMALHADFPLPDEDSLLRNYKRWEKGGGVSADYQLVIARMYGTVPGAIFPREPKAPHLKYIDPLDPGETLDLVQRLRSSSVDATMLENMHITVERLCSEYSFRSATELQSEARLWLAQMNQLNDRPMRLAQRTEVLALAGWLTLLLSCLEYDTGQPAAAEASRKGAILLGEDIGHSEILGWGAEIKCWMALTRGDYHAVVAAAREGQAVSTRHFVTVQLAAQEAKAWARLGNRSRTELALESGRKLLEGLGFPDNPQNHFQVDPSKFDFYAMDCYRQVGENDLALNAAHQVIRASTTPDGTSKFPMRIVEARMTEAMIASRKGDLEGAITIATDAMKGPRQSLPSLAMVGQELATDLRRRYPKERLTNDYVEQLRALGKGA